MFRYARRNWLLIAPCARENECGYVALRIGWRQQSCDRVLWLPRGVSPTFLPTPQHNVSNNSGICEMHLQLRITGRLILCSRGIISFNCTACTIVMHFYPEYFLFSIFIMLSEPWGTAFFLPPPHGFVASPITVTNNVFQCLHVHFYRNINLATF